MRIIVAPVAVRAHGWAESSNPLSEELRLIPRAHQNMEPAEPARLRAAAAGTMSMAVTSSTPMAWTANMTISERRAVKIY